MSKKRTKSPAANTGAADNKWETIISSTELNTENWTYSLAILAPECINDQATIDYINKGVGSGLRRKFTLINEEIILQTINEYGGNKNKKPKDAPAYSDVCEVAKAQLDKEGVLSPDIKAKVIKWIIMNAKTIDMQTQPAKKASDGKASKAGKKGEKSVADRAKSGGKKGAGPTGGGKRSPEPPSVKKDSKLRKRGDPDPDIPYIDDEPDDGSSRYFILSGQHNCSLIDSLATIGCIATTIIKITRDVHIPIQGTEKSRRKSMTSSKKEDENDVDVEEEISDEMKKTIECIEEFWKGINEVLSGNKNLLDTPILGLEAKHLMFPLDDSDEEMKKTCSMELFEILACILYELLDKKRQWQNYLSQSFLYRLPEKKCNQTRIGSAVSQTEAVPQETDETGGSGQTPRHGAGESRVGTEATRHSRVVETFNDVNLEQYHHVLTNIPVDLTSIHMQLAAMLDQVEVTLGDKEPSYAQLDSTNQNIEQNMERSSKIMKTILEQIYFTKEQRKELLDNDLNDIMNDENEIDNINEENASIHTMDLMTICSKQIQINQGKDMKKDNQCTNGLLKELKILIQSFQHLDIMLNMDLDTDIERKRAARLFELITYLDNSNLSKLEIDHAIRVFILESLTITGTDENGIICNQIEEGLIHKIKNQVWDDPFMIMDQIYQEILDQENALLKQKRKLELLNEAYDSETSNLSESGVESQKHLQIDLDQNNQLNSGGILKSGTRSSLRSQSNSPAGSRSQSRSPINNSSPRITRRKSSVRFQEIEIDDENEKCEANGTKQELDDGDDDAVGGDDKKQKDTKNLQNILIDIMENIRKRTFTEWCFEEFYEPHVLLQIINKAIYKLPFIDIYHMRQDNRKLLIMNNPFHEELKMNYQPWDHWLHSNVGFRNYLDHVAEKITDWTRDQEAIYQAQLLNRELEREKTELSENEASDKEVPKKGGKGAPAKGKKSPKSKSRSRSNSKSSVEDGDDKEQFLLVLPGSLKAQKLEKDKLERQREEEERKKEEKRILSARKKAEKEAAKVAEKTAKESKRPGSKSSTKSKATKKSIVETIADGDDKNQLTDRKEQDDEYWPFISYDLGDFMAHFNGEIMHLFPDDGNLIRINKFKNISGVQNVRLSLITNSDHVFTIHIVDPILLDNSDPINSLLIQSQQAANQYSSTTCVFDNGLCIASSMYAIETTNSNLTDEIKSESATHRSDDPVIADIKSEGKPMTPKSDKLTSSNQDKSPGVTVAMVTVPVPLEPEPQLEVNGLPNIVVSTPDGTQVKIGYEKESLILQMKQTKFQPITEDDQINLSNHCPIEINRYVTQQGHVICVFSNDHIKILYPDGSIAETTVDNEIETIVKEIVPEVNPDNQQLQKELSNTKKKGKQAKGATDPSQDQIKADEEKRKSEQPEIHKIRKWKITESYGNKYYTKTNLENLTIVKMEEEKVIEEQNDEIILENEDCNDKEGGEEIEKKKLEYIEHVELEEPIPLSTATDPSTQEEMITRGDKTIILKTPGSGIYLTEHEDGTRFSKYIYYEKPIQKNKETRIIECLLIESKKYPAIIINKTDNSIETRFGSMGSLISQPNGYHTFKHEDSTEIEYRNDGEIIFTPSLLTNMEFLQPMGSCSYVLNPDSYETICHLVDNDGTQFLIDNQGDYQISKTQNKDAIITDNKEQIDEEEIKKKPTSAISMGVDVGINQKLKKYDLHAPRIFVINSDGSGSELLRYRDIVDFLIKAQINDEYVKYKEELQDCPQINAHTIFHPIEYQKPWQYSYSRKSILPSGLTCRDLKTLPNFNIQTTNDQLTDMVQLESISIPNEPMKLDYETYWNNPMLFRQFYHYPLLTEDVRNKLQSQLISYNENIIARKEKYKAMEVNDERTEEENQESAQILQKYMTQTLNLQVLDNAVNQLKTPKNSDASVSEVNRREIVSPEQENQLEQSTATTTEEEPSTSKKLDMIIERQRIEKEIEMKNKEALRNKIIPNYFTSIYGQKFVSNQALDLKTLNELMKIYPNSREISAKKETDLLKDQLDEEIVKEKKETNRHTSERDSKEFNEMNLGSSKMSFSKQGIQQGPVIKKKKKSFLYYDSSLILPENRKVLPKSTDLDLPNYLYSERPQVRQNLRQALIEDPVRLQVKTTSMVGGSRLGQLFQRQTRGINVLPARIDAGLLREGRQYIGRFQLINTGPESCRFKIPQPTKSGWLWVEFLPGPIPAGLSRNINVHIYGIGTSENNNNNNNDINNGVTLLEHNLMITTDTDILCIPITAYVMIGSKYDEVITNENDSKKKSFLNNLRRQTITMNK